MMHRTKDLSAEQRIVLEGLLGRSLSEEESVSVKALGPTEILPSPLSEDQRKAVVAKLDQYFAAIDSRHQPVGAEEEEALMDEAMRSVRPGYRPIR